MRWMFLCALAFVACGTSATAPSALSSGPPATTLPPPQPLHMTVDITCLQGGVNCNQGVSVGATFRLVEHHACSQDTPAGEVATPCPSLQGDFWSQTGGFGAQCAIDGELHSGSINVKCLAPDFAAQFTVDIKDWSNVVLGEQVLNLNVS